jgi:hypothetical protein
MLVMQELCEKTPPKHGRVLVGANNEALQESGGHRALPRKFRSCTPTACQRFPLQLQSQSPRPPYYETVVEGAGGQRVEREERVP